VKSHNNSNNKGHIDMTEVQRNFKRQIKETEKERIKYWKKEIYKDHFKGKKYIRYYDQNNHLMKTEELKSSKIKSFFIGLFGVIFAVLLYFAFPFIISLVISIIRNIKG
jgi:VIT1/CCC1 family predicted Fe2+/Mn2+ transporter